MALIGTSELMALLVCPRCHTPLATHAQAYHCTNQACIYAAHDSFPIAGMWPAVVDWERSVLDKQMLLATPASSAVQRTPATSLRKRLKHIVLPLNMVAPGNVRTLIERTKQCTEHPVVLDIGGGTVGTASQLLHDDPAIRLISFDVYGSATTQFIADGHQIPLPDASVDAVVIQAVLEHVLDPWQVVREIERVLRDDGIVYSEIPFMQQVHEGPYDFTQFTQSGHRYLYKQFCEIDSGIIGGSGEQLSWTINYVARGLFRSRAIGNVARLALFWVRYLDRIIPTPYAVDNASATYFLGHKAQYALSPKDILAYYKGAG
jgi:SAM-dependent methyltransferase